VSRWLCPQKPIRRLIVGQPLFLPKKARDLLAPFSYAVGYDVGMKRTRRQKLLGLVFALCGVLTIPTIYRTIKAMDDKRPLADMAICFFGLICFIIAMNLIFEMKSGNAS
jgi:hypothetical protein